MRILVPFFLLLWIYAIVHVVKDSRLGNKFVYHPFGVSEANTLKGILAIGIVLSHLQNFCYGSHGCGPLAQFAQVGVFFFISGYGLTSAYLHKGHSYLNGFLKHRLSKVIVPLVIATGVYLVECYIIPIGGGYKI